jgi:hypothetical protein
MVLVLGGFVKFFQARWAPRHDRNSEGGSCGTDTWHTTHSMSKDLTASQKSSLSAAIKRYLRDELGQDDAEDTLLEYVKFFKWAYVVIHFSHGSCAQTTDRPRFPFQGTHSVFVFHC